MGSVQKASRKQEERVAQAIGGSRTPGSGNTWARKNDVRSDTLSMELKITANKQYALKSAELETGRLNALRDGLDFAFMIEFPERAWVVISEDDWLVLNGS